MAEISRTALFGKLNPLAYKAIEGATVFCKLRGNPYVELQHWLQQILNQPDSDLHRIAKQYELDKETKQAEITLVKAKAEAEAIQVTAAALAKSPSVIDLEVVKKWDGRSPTTLVVGGENVGGAKIVLPIQSGGK